MPYKRIKGITQSESKEMKDIKNGAIILGGGFGGGFFFGGGGRGEHSFMELHLSYIHTYTFYKIKSKH